MSYTPDELKKIFGKQSRGTSAEDRAKSSDVIFVRSQDELSLYHEGATGRKLSAWEALETFGLEVLGEAVYKGSAILVDSKEEPARTFKNRREALGLTREDVSQSLGLTNELIDDIENPRKKNPIRSLELVAQYLGLDERKVTFQRGLEGDNALALRLKDLKSTVIKSKTVLSFTEAAWVIAVEDRLREWLKIKRDKTIGRKFSPSDEYGDASHPAYKIGYDLALKSREILGISPDKPIESLRELCINKLALPVVQYELPPSIAGATVANNKSRGIVVNIRGRNDNVWIRRATIAHELGHLLWDPEQKLERIRVDDYDEIDEGWSSEKERLDYVEQRANAFAAELLAPKEVAANVYRKNGLRAVMEIFGVSFTLARWQVWNGLYQTEPFESFSVVDTDPTDEWKGRESFTAEYFPIESIPISRRGFFAGLVVIAESKNLISKDTAIQYLHCSEYEYDKSKHLIPGLFNLPFNSQTN